MLWNFGEPKQLKKYGVNYQIYEVYIGFWCGYNWIENYNTKPKNKIKKGTPPKKRKKWISPIMYLKNCPIGLAVIENVLFLKIVKNVLVSLKVFDYSCFWTLH